MKVLLCRCISIITKTHIRIKNDMNISFMDNLLKHRKPTANPKNNYVEKWIPEIKKLVS